MGPRRTEAAVAVAIFIVAAIGGGAYYARDIRLGGRPFFYQTYFEPAVMLACGKGFLISQHQPPALQDFLFEKTDHFSCDELPRDLKVGTEGLVQRPWRYLMTSVAVAWMVLGISWSGLAPLFGVFYGSTTLLAYALCRLIVGRIAAAACAAVLSVSSLQLANLPNLRDYAKAPFTLALVLILIALVVRPWRPRDVLMLSLCYGLVLGVGYGFRTDLLIDIPPFLIAIAFFLPGGVLRDVSLRVAAVGLFTAGFVAAGWPIISAVGARGGCQWHVFLLGLTTPFNDALGVSGGAYSWGHLYKDEYLWATVSSYATRFRPDLGYIEYCSREYDVASWQYLRHILVTFPADIVTRAYASALQVLDLPFRRFDVLKHTGPLLAAVFVLAISSASLRLALFAAFVILYFGGYPAIQFMPRHYFPFEFITLAVLAFLIERGARVGMAIARESRADRPTSTATVRSVAVCAVILTVALLAPLGLLRWYQNEQASRLLESYVASATSAVPLEAVAPGRFRLPEDDARRLSQIEAVAALGRATARFVETELDAGACRPGTTVTFQYDPTYPATDFSQTVSLQTVTQVGQPTRLYEPVYAGFRGIDVSDPSPACVPRVSIVDDVDRLPLLLSVQLPPEWASQPQYQRISRIR